MDMTAMAKKVLYLLSMLDLSIGSLVNKAIIKRNRDDMTELFSTLKSHPSVDGVILNVSQHHRYILYQEAVYVGNMNERQTYFVPEETCNRMSAIAHHQMKTKSVTCFRSRDSTSSLMLYLPVVQYSTSIYRMIQHLEWSNILIITDDQHASRGLFMVFSSAGVFCSTILFNSSSDIYDMLHSIPPDIFPWHFLLLTNFSSAVQILQEADSFDVRNRRRSDMRSSSQWLVVVQKGNLEVFDRDIWVDNIALIVYPKVNINTVVLESYSDSLQGDIFTLMYRQSGRELVHIGSCGHDVPIEVNSEIFPNSKFGLNGRLFTISTLRWLPYTLTRNESGKVVFDGICMDIIKELAQVMNFTYRIIHPPDMEWGAKDSNGKYTGLVGQMQRNKIDMIVAALAVTRDRADVMDFSYPIGFDNGVGIYKLPDSNTDRWLTLIRPFTLSLHILITIAFVVCTLLLCALRLWHRLSGRESSLSDTWLIMFGLFIRQSTEVKSGHVSSSFLLSFIGLFGTIIATIYCGNMMAFFTVSKQKLPFTTLPEVTKQTTYKWGTLGGLLWSTSFKLSNDPDHQMYWQGIMNFIITDPYVLHGSDIVHKAKVKRGHYVFVVESDILRSWKQEDCSLRLLSDTLYPMRYALGLPQHSPYRKVVSDRILLFYERGMLDKWRKKWMNEEDSCVTQESSKGTSITLMDLQSAFYLLGVGIVAAVVIEWKLKTRCV